MTRDPLLPVRLVDGVWTTEGATVEIGGQTVRAAVTWGEPGVRVRNFPCFPDPSVFADVVLPPRPADDYARAFAEYNPPPRSEVEITVTMDADEAPELYRLRGDDEQGWMIDDDPLLRVWDTAADAMAEVPGDWWEEEAGCWMAATSEPNTAPRRADNARKVVEHVLAHGQRTIFAAVALDGSGVWAIGDTAEEARSFAGERRTVAREDAQALDLDFPDASTDAAWLDGFAIVTLSGTTESLRALIRSMETGDPVAPWCPADLWDYTEPVKES